MLKNLLVLSDIYLSTRSIEALISGSVVGALQNLGVYDIDIWDTTKDILGKLVSIDDLSATFNPDKLIANSDEVVYGLGDMSKTITSVREGIDGLVTELSHIGEYDIDIWNVLSSIDKILTNGAIASLGEYLGFLCEELLSSRLGIDSIADIFTDFPATIAKILSAILSLPLNLLYSLFILTPKQMVEDYIKRPADFFKPQGLIIFTGRQGRGKTVAMAEYIQHLQACYPKSKCITNFDFKYQNDELCHWKQLIDYKNAQKGVIVGMDELQNWFSSNQSRNFPPEMLSVITQNRKNRRVILGTSQNFYLLAKAIRSQATEVRECMTLAGCFTIVRCREPILDDKGDVKEWKNRGFYWFTHTPKIRNSYDTYKVIESLSESGFVERAVPQAYDEA